MKKFKSFLIESEKKFGFLRLDVDTKREQRGSYQELSGNNPADAIIQQAIEHGYKVLTNSTKGDIITLKLRFGRNPQDEEIMMYKTVKLRPMIEAFDWTNKIGARAFNNARAWLSVKNSGVKDRCLWLLDKDEVSFWGASATKKVYRWYHNDEPTRGNVTGIVRVDLQAGTVQFPKDLEKDNLSDQKLYWDRKYMLASFSVFDKKVIENQ